MLRTAQNIDNTEAVLEMARNCNHFQVLQPPTRRTKQKDDVTLRDLARGSYRRQSPSLPRAPVLKF